MKTAIALFAAALSVAALSTNASAQKLMPTAGMKAPKLVANAGTTFMTGSAGGTSWREVGGLPSPSTFLTSGADTSFGTRSGGDFKLVSQSADIAVEKMNTSIDDPAGLVNICDKTPPIVTEIDPGGSPTPTTLSSESNFLVFGVFSSV